MLAAEAREPAELGGAGPGFEDQDSEALRTAALEPELGLNQRVSVGFFK